MRANSKRNDDFDFGLDEDIDGGSPAPAAKGKQQPKNNQHDFFGLDEDQEERSRLPVINQPSKSKLPTQIKTTGKGDTKLQKIANKDATYDFLDEEVEEEPVVKQSPAPAYQRSEARPISSQVQKGRAPPKEEPSIEHKTEEKGEQEYAEDYEADAYGDDFEDFHEETKSPAKHNSGVGAVSQKIAQAPKTVVTSKLAQPSKTVVKQQSLRKNMSRASLKSEKSKRSVSRSRIDNYSSANEDIAKFSKEVDTNFPDVDLNGMPMDSLNRLNERVRGMIRRLNDQLNEILTRNTMLLKAKKEERGNSKGAEERIKILQEEKKNNEKVLDRMDEEIKRMRHREGKVKDEDYEVDIHKRILALIETKKETEREIYRLKLNVSNEGKRLTVDTEKKDQDNQNSFKTDLVHQKKEELRLTELLRTVDKKLQDMEPKYAETQQKLNQLLKEAANLGVDVVPVKSSLKNKYDELMKKHENEKKNLGMQDGLFKSKKQKHLQESTALKKNVQTLEAQIKSTHSEIEHVIEECRLVIEKAKENPRLPKSIDFNLDAISRSLVVNETDFDHLIEKNEKNSESLKPRLDSAGKKKSNSQHEQQHQEFLPLNPKKLAKNLEEDKGIPSSAAKPNFKKKDPTTREENNAERVWKDDNSDKGSLREPPLVPNSMPVQPPPKQQVREEPKPAADDGFKPTFMLKKRNNGSSLNLAADSVPKETSSPQVPSQQPKLLNLKKDVAPAQQTALQVEDKPFGGRMMRLRAKEPQKEMSSAPSNQSTIDPKPAEQTGAERKLQLNDERKIGEPAEVVDEDKPKLPPRRMMLRRKEQEGEGGYNPNFKSQAEPVAAPSQPYKPSEEAPKPVVNNPYAPSKPEEPSKNPYAPSTSLFSHDEGKPPATDNKPMIQISRRQQQAADPPKEEKTAPPPQPAPVVNTTPQVISSSNPYAPKETTNQEPIRQREGRLKKPKMEVVKEKITNIYEAAEEQIVNEFVPERRPDPKPVIQLQDAPRPQHKHEELDINQLLGIGSKQKDEEDDALFGNKKAAEKKPARRRGQEDFFDGIDV